MADEAPKMSEDEQRKLETLSGVTAAPMFMCLSVIGALKLRGLIEPEEVAKLADFFATTGQHNAPPLSVATMQARLKEFAMMVRSLENMPSGEPPQEV